MSDTFTFNIEHYFNSSDVDVLLSYKGPFEKGILSTLAHYLTNVVDDKSIQRKLQKIFIELADNVAQSALAFVKTGATVEGAISLLKYADQYVLSTGNLVRSTEIDKIVEQINHINTLDADGLRAYKRYLLSITDENAIETQFINLIKTALAAEQKIQFHQTQLNVNTILVTIRVIIDSTHN